MTTVKLPITGGCACGAIRYEITVEPNMMKCHCRDCQHVTGGPFAPALVAPREAFRLTRGQLRYHFTASLAGGKHKRGFCPDCGSRLTGAENEAGDSPWVGVLAGSLDDPSWFKPRMDIFVSDAQPWDQMDPAIPKFDQYPPMPAED
jgi:hypothetical protein